MDTHALTNKMRRFGIERDWDKFHSPKNIAASISVESAELLEIFQWSKGQSLGEFNDKIHGNKMVKELAGIFI